MAWTEKLLLAGVVGLGGLFVVGRISGGKQSGAPSGGPATGSPIAGSPMKGSTYATAVPVYPGAKLTDNMGGDHYNEIGGTVTFTSQSWFFKVSDPVATIAEFYRKNLPPGAKPAEAEAGSVAFEWIPPGAVEGELVHITIREGELQIGETVKAKGN